MATGPYSTLLDAAAGAGRILVAHWLRSSEGATSAGITFNVIREGDREDATT